MVRKIIRRISKGFASFVATQGPYHFLVKDWQSITDIDVLEKVFSTEYFHFQLEPVQPNVAQYQKVLVLAPHQDDESIGPGGLLCKISDEGGRIHVLFTTDGSQNNLGVTLSESIRIRNSEAQKALNQIGAKHTQLSISNFQPIVSIAHIVALRDTIRHFGPDLILLPWFLDTPVKHRLINHMLYLAYEMEKWKNVDIWGYQVHNHLYPNIAIDISDAIDRKMAMISCYHTQNSLFRNYPHITKGLNAYNSKFLKGAQYAEIYFGLPTKEYMNCIAKFYLVDIAKLYRGDRELVRDLENLTTKLVER